MSDHPWMSPPPAEVYAQRMRDYLTLVSALVGKSLTLNGRDMGEVFGIEVNSRNTIIVFNDERTESLLASDLFAPGNTIVIEVSV